MRTIRNIGVFCLGAYEGIRYGTDNGRTYASSHRNEAYDRGLNAADKWHAFAAWLQDSE